MRRLQRLLLTCIAAIGLLTLGAKASAAAAPTADRDAILKFAGCYEITFDFKETFAQAPGYKFYSPYHNQAVEYVTVNEDTGDRISLQHILVFRSGVQKHWRQEWTYEPESLFQFKGNSTWQKTSLTGEARAGRWVQKVFNVDDSPRYECAAPWVHWADQSYWECETDRPLPRREYTVRSDYQIVQARNRQQIRPDGWILEEDNVKVALENGKRKNLVEEKGKNQYFKVSDARCKAGADYWKQNADTWKSIVAAWDDIYRASSTLKLATPASGQPELYEVLFELADRAEKAKMPAASVTSEATKAIQGFVTN